MYVASNYIMNGMGHGEVGEAFQDIRFEPGLARPFLDKHGRAAVTIQDGFTINKETGERQPKYVNRLLRDLGDMSASVPITNASLALRKDEWIRLDQAVIKTALPRMRAWGDLRAANSIGGFDGMGSTIFEHEVMDDPGIAYVDMDGLTEGSNDGARYQLRGTPLPIIHSGFSMSARQLAVSRNRGQALDTTRAEQAARRVAEEIERMTIGITDGLQYGSQTEYDQASKIWGYLSHPDRITKTDMNVPNGTNGEDVVADILELRDLLYKAHHYGPFLMYTSCDWDRWLDTDFKAAVSGTLRQRIQAIDGISSIRRLDFLDPAYAAVNNYTVILVDLSDSTTARAINGMEMRTIQWLGRGGQEINFKVMAIQVPQLRSDFYGHMGLAVGNAP